MERDAVDLVHLSVAPLHHIRRPLRRHRRRHHGHLHGTDADVAAIVRIDVTATNFVGSTTAAGTPTIPVSPGQPWPTGDRVIAAAGDVACDQSDPCYDADVGASALCRQKYIAHLLCGAVLVQTGALPAPA
jgi:hypothetical protein